MKTNYFFKKMVWAMAIAATCFVCEANAQNDDPYKEFVSPQWGLKCPEGHTRLTEYRAEAENNPKAKKQYNKLMKRISKAQAKREKVLKKAFKKEGTRFVEAEKKAMKKAQKYLKRKGYELLPLGTFRLKDDTKLILDDKHTLTPKVIEYHANAKSKTPTLEREKSPNYDAHNEQTWPIYTNVETTPNRYVDGVEVYRGENCTYVVRYNQVAFDYHWFHPKSGDALVDPETGDRYMVRYLEHFPLDTYLWIHGQEGKTIRRVYVYPPLPEHVKRVDLIPSRIPASERLSNVAPYKVYQGLKVRDASEMQNGKTIY